MSELPKGYTPKDREPDVLKQWERSGYANPNNLPGKRTISFTITLPPPNATSKLHLGHAVMVALQDLMIRFERMRGKRALWTPGTDHAAIATQNVVEKELKKEGKRRQDLGREAFLERVEKYVESQRGTIKSQIRRMGASCDWSRERFTLDDQSSTAVTEAFKRLYEAGLIYRGLRVVNWCPKDQSTLADDEVEYEERPTTLYTFKYDANFPFAIATTRPETKLGDTAVAVNPSDKRYAQYVGKVFTMQIGGVGRTIKVVADRGVDPEYGTGALGVTPAHSASDEAIARREKLPSIKVIGEDGHMTLGAGPNYAGLKVTEAREKLIAELKAAGLVEKEEATTHNLSVCYRCGTPVEPLPSDQWFVAVEKSVQFPDGTKGTLKDRALKAVTSGDIRIIPEHFTKTYTHWFENLHDWCISRQIWYGHRVPVWYCMSCNHPIIDPKVVSTWYLVRHGETDWNIQKNSIGHSDVPLNATGIAQAERVAGSLVGRGIDLVVSSDFTRSRMTAEIIAKKLGVELVLDADLRERDAGDATGMSRDEVIKKYGSMLSYDNKAPNGESLQEVENRVWPAFQKHQKKHRHRNVVIVSHGGSLRMLVRRLRNLTPDEALARATIENAAVLPMSFGSSQCAKCGGEVYEQDPDTLDTWFSSSLWTFSTLGWPKKTKDLKTFHPTDVMETGYDILFFWVARMILMSTYLVGEVPFKTVYLHGLVRDKQGRKMSKSLGNGIDPVEMAEKYGADAVRLSLIIGTSPGNDQRLAEDKIAGFRNYANKIWNIGRFVLLNAVDEKGKPKAATLSDRWIMSRLNGLIEETTARIEKFEFSQAGEKLYDFAWHEFADWYLEIAKVEGNHELTREVFETTLKLLHPFMPFVTEALWEHHKGKRDLLMIQDWPTPDGSAIDEEAEKEFSKLQDRVTALRVQRKEVGLTGKAPLGVKPNLFDREHQAVIERLATVTFAS